MIAGTRVCRRRDQGEARWKWCWWEAGPSLTDDASTCRSGEYLLPELSFNYHDITCAQPCTCTVKSVAKVAIL
jgi:hypothetical protein